MFTKYGGYCYYVTNRREHFLTKNRTSIGVTRSVFMNSTPCADLKYRKLCNRHLDLPQRQRAILETKPAKYRSDCMQTRRACPRNRSSINKKLLQNIMADSRNYRDSSLSDAKDKAPLNRRCKKASSKGHSPSLSKKKKKKKKKQRPAKLKENKGTFLSVESHEGISSHHRNVEKKLKKEVESGKKKNRFKPKIWSSLASNSVSSVKSSTGTAAGLQMWKGQNSQAVISDLLDLVKAFMCQSSALEPARTHRIRTNRNSLTPTAANTVADNLHETDTAYGSVFFLASVTRPAYQAAATSQTTAASSSAALYTETCEYDYSDAVLPNISLTDMHICPLSIASQSMSLNRVDKCYPTLQSLSHVHGYGQPHHGLRSGQLPTVLPTGAVVYDNIEDQETANSSNKPSECVFISASRFNSMNLKLHANIEVGNYLYEDFVKF